MINISGVFAPLLILFVLIGGALLLIRFISKHFPAMRRKERWLLPIYGAVLVACGIILAFLEPFEERTASGEEERLSSLSLYSYIEFGNIKKIDSEYIRKEWDFTHTDGDLRISSEPSHEFMASIFVEKVPGLENKVEVTYYETPLYVDGEDMSNYIRPPEATLSKDLLKLSNPVEHQYVELYTFREPFPYNQFIERKLVGNQNESSVFHGENIILIRVGEEKTLDLDPDSYIEYVN